MDVFTLLALVAALFALRLLLPFLRSLTSPLRSVPGPLWTRLTRLWYFYQVRTGSFHLTNIALHRKYGPLVRIMPDHYSLDDPSAIKLIYGISSKFPKSAWYEGWKHPDPDRWTLFPDRNIERHAKTRRLFQNIYSLSSLVTYETYVDECATILSQRLNEFAQSGEMIDMGHWFQCYAFDVIGNITFSSRFGFLDAGQDVNGTMAALHSNMAYSSLSGIFPSWYPWHYKIMEKIGGTGAAGRSYLMKFTSRQVSKRKGDTSEGKLKLDPAGSPAKRLGDGEDDSDHIPKDFLAKIMEAREADPQKVSEYHVFMMCLSNIIAGSDTTATSLSAILYYLLKYPAVMRKLRAEIEEHEASGKLGTNAVMFKETQAMPYFQAVLKEALRCHPATGLPLWRVVPQGGAEICGRFFPAGTVVGANTWVAHYNEDVFGPDAREFRPERWIEAEQDGGETLKEMDAYYFPFGLGSRTCLGRHISWLEMSKLIPRLVRDFEFELEHPERYWQCGNFWFVKPTDFRLKVTKRATA